MSRIATVLDNGFEDSEFSEPYAAFTGAGHELTIIGFEKRKHVAGKRRQASATVDVAIDDARPEDYDALFIPGGNSPDHVRAHPGFVKFTRAFAERDQPILAICHGPQLLSTADAIGDHKLTAYKTIQDDLRRMGFNVVDEEVVVDRNLVTSRQPGDIPAFIRESLKVLQKVSAHHS